MLSFSPRDALDEIWDLTESVSEGFPTYSSDQGYTVFRIFLHFWAHYCSVNRSGGGVVDNTLDYQSRGSKIDPPLLRSFG